jgi:hypothetical protein
MDGGKLNESFDCSVKEFELYTTDNGTVIEQLEEQYEMINCTLLLNMDQNRKTTNRTPCLIGKGRESNIFEVLLCANKSFTNHFVLVNSFCSQYKSMTLFLLSLIFISRISCNT